MFLSNKYSKWYFSLIERAKVNPRTPCERHHVIPRSMGGSDDQENIVCLSPREHCICHLLLCKFVSGEAKYKMVFAALMMTEVKSKNHERKYKINSRIYEALRQQRAEAISTAKRGRPMSDEQKKKLSESVKGFKHTPEAKEAISKASKNRRHTEESKQKISEVKKGIATRGSGWTTSEETKQKQSDSQKGRTFSEEHKAKLREAAKNRKKNSSPTP